MAVIVIENGDNCLSLRHLRDFVESTRDLPEDTPLKLDYDDTNPSDIINIQGDEDSIVFYNW